MGSTEEHAAVLREGYWNKDGWQTVALTMYPRLAATTHSAVESAGGTFVDLTGVFDDETGSTYAEDAVHYTALGNRRLAQALAEVIRRRTEWNWSIR